MKLIETELQLIKELNCDEIRALNPKRLTQDEIDLIKEDKDCFD